MSGLDERKNKNKDNRRQYSHIGGWKNLPRNVSARRLVAAENKVARATRTDQEQLVLIETRPGASLKERERLEQRIQNSKKISTKVL